MSVKKSASISVHGPGEAVTPKVSLPGEGVEAVTPGISLPGEAVTHKVSLPGEAVEAVTPGISTSR